MAQRPQVNTQLQAPELTRTVARPASDRAVVYTPQQSRSAALAQSLVSLAPTLQGYVQEFQKDYQEAEENRAYDEIQGMTYDEAQELVKSGSIRETESPWYQAAFEKQFGTVYAKRRRQELVDRYNTEFDKHNGNIDEFAAEFAGEDLDKFGGSKFVMSGYRNAMAGVLDELKSNHGEWKSNWTRDRVTENFGTLAYDAIAETVAAGGDLNDTLKNLKGEHAGALGMTFPEMDAQLFGVAERLAAEGDVEALEALLYTDFTGPDGTKVGSFANRSKYAKESDALLEQARAVAGKADREQNTATITGLKMSADNGKLDLALATELRDSEQISQAEYESLIIRNDGAKDAAIVSAGNKRFEEAVFSGAMDAIQSGRGYAIRDETYVNAQGKTVTITANEQVERTVIAVMDNMARNDASPQAMAEELSRMGVDQTYPAWENILSDGHLPLTEIGVMGEDGSTEIPETSLRAYDLYKAMNDTPQIRSRHINNTEAEDVWSTAMLLEQHGYSVEDALIRAAKPASEADQANANRFGREQFETLAERVRPKFFGEEMANGAAAVGRIEKLAKFYISRGVKPKDAVNNAIRDYDNSHTTINGVSVNTRNVYLPPNFEEASRVALEEFAELHGEDVDELTLIPAHNGSNNWTIAYKGNVAMPVQIEDADTSIHVSEITRTYTDFRNRQEAEQKRQMQEAIEQNRAKAEYQQAMEAAVQENRAMYAKWKGMSRRDRREAGLPVWGLGASTYFSDNSAKRRFKQQWEAQNQPVKPDHKTGRKIMQSEEADKIMQQMGISDPANP